MSTSLPTDPPIDPAPTQRGRRRLVPDLTDTIEVGGERLARVVRAPAESASDPDPSPKSLDEVARRHISPAVVEVAEKFPELLSALAEAEQGGQLPPERTPREVASRIELFSDGDVVVPHPEPDAQKREGVVSLSPVIGLDDAPDFLRGSRSPETLFDLFSMFPELDGINQWIYVERKEPVTYSGRKVAGIQRKIVAPLTLSEWQDIYGGGTYKLIVYGPPKRGGVMRLDGRMQSVKLTEPITVRFPGVPSFESEVFDGDDDMTASQQPGNIPGRRGPASMADAQIEKERLTVDAAREVRQESHVERERSRADAAVQEKSRAEQTLLGKFMEQQDKAAQREAELRAQQVEREREIADERRANDEKWEARIQALIGEKKPDDLDRLAKLSTIIGKPDNSDSLREQHAREMERVQITAKQDADRSATFLRAEQDRCDRRVAEEQARANDRIKEVEKRLADFEREMRERSDREIQRTKDECERRVGDMHRQHTDAMALAVAQHAAAMTAETRNHERDMSSLKAQHAMAMDSQKGTYEMRLETARGEVKRTQGEVERYKGEAEGNKDVVGKLRKLREDAAELGMVEAADNAPEPQTVVQMLTQAGAGLFQQLPSIVESISSAVKTRSAQEVEAARAQGRSEMVSAAGNFPSQFPPPHRRRSPELGGGGFEIRHMSEVGPAPVSPGHDPLVVPPPQQHFESVPVPQMQPQMQAGFQPPPMPMEMPPMAAPTTQIVPVAASQPPPPAPAPQSAPPPPPAGVDPALLAEDRQILHAEVMVLPHYEANVPAGAVADAMIANFGVEEVRKTLVGVDAERVILAITRAGSPNSPFLRRDGKKYLRLLFSELRKKAA